MEGASLRLCWQFSPLLLLAFLAISLRGMAQELPLPRTAVVDDTHLVAALPALARLVRDRYRNENRDAYLSDLLRIQMVAGDLDAAQATALQWEAQHEDGPGVAPAHFSLGTRLSLQARLRQRVRQESFEDAYRAIYREVLGRYDDRRAYDANWALGTFPGVLRRGWQPILERQKDRDTLTLEDAVRLVVGWADFDAAQASWTLNQQLTREDEERRYVIEPELLIRTPRGARLSAIVVRARDGRPRPTALRGVIQTLFQASLQQAKFAASRGYVGMEVDTRGKRLSPDPIVLFEKDAEDMAGVIDWISRQPWSDGQVGMYGGSNTGFTQWAAAKSLPPALKTLVPYCPEEPGYGLPMENNVFSLANYDMLLELASKLPGQYQDRNRSEPLLRKWYESGRPFRQIDEIDGIPNPWLHKFLDHPAYDAYWQSLAAHGRDYSRLRIPILAIDGYYDDGQSNAVRRLRDHYRYRPDAEHYLVIGPYDHWGVQSPWKSQDIRGYAIDPVAQFDTAELTFQWFDHVMKQGPRPAMLKDRINFQVMGANEWRSAPSIEAMSSAWHVFYLDPARSGDFHSLSPDRPESGAAITQRVNLADRTTTSFGVYPGQVLSERPDFKDAQVFISDPFDSSVEMSGLFSARLRLITNKKDLDIALALYEVTPSGQFFHLSWTLQRASFARDMTRRKLLAPGRPQTVPLDNTHLVSRRLSPGSRLLVAVTVNRSPYYQINYGTGGDVADESLADAGEPLQVQWLGDSTVSIPLAH